MAVIIAMNVNMGTSAVRADGRFRFIAMSFPNPDLTAGHLSDNFQVLQIHITGHGRSFLLHAQCFYAFP
jgi:hypothetical protein